MSNLFAVFNPSVLNRLPLNFLVLFIVIIILVPKTFWLNNQIEKRIKLPFKFLTKDLTPIFGMIIAPGIILISVRLLRFIFSLNLIGLIPYIFTATTHITFTFTLALPLWVGHILIGWIKTPFSILAHLVPVGTPSYLIPFIVLIEIIRRVIRPLTLSVRLAANIIAGHLLITLLSGGASSVSWLILRIILISLVILRILETAVAIIQGHIFSILRSLYLREVNNKQLRI